MTHFSWDGTQSFAVSNDSSADASSPGPGPVLPPVLPGGATILTVGAGEEFSSLSAAVSAAPNGAIILVDAGTYVNDFAIVSTAITIMGVGGIANFVATEPPTDLKGILTVDNNVTVENCSFSGAAISAWAGSNGAGIRYEGGNMVLENDSFSNNQDGIMGSPVIPGLTQNTVSIDHCLFQDNGDGDGFTHNAYIGTVTQLTFTNNISEGAIVGHELKSRAYTNIIENNVFQDGPTGTASYEIDLPDGGVDTVANNTIEKGPNAQNEAMIHFGGEGIPYAGSTLTVQGNTFLNDYGPAAVAVLNQTPYSTTITGNSFANIPLANIVQGPAVETDNTDGNGNPLPNTTLTGVLPGNTVIFTDDLPHTISLTGSVQAVEGGGGLLTATAIDGHVIALGGTGGMDYSESPISGGNTVTTAAGSTNILTLGGQDLVSSGGTDTVTCGTGNVSGVISGNATVYDGTGNNQWSVSGTANITGQGGNPEISVGSAGNASVTGTVGFLSVQNNGGDFSYSIGEDGDTYQAADTGGAVYAAVSAGTMSITTGAGGGGGPAGADLTLGEGTALVTSVGNDTITAGSGNDTLILEGGATVYAGTGKLSIYGRSDTVGATVYGDGGTYLFAGDTGNITYYGGSASSTVQAALSNITLIGGTGKLRVAGGSRDVMTGGAGGLVYTASDGGGANLITTQAGAIDRLILAAGDIVNSYGNDLISEGAGNQTINVYGRSVVQGGTGNNVLVFGGTDFLNGVGQDSVTVLPGATAVINAGQLTGVSETGATDVIYTVGGASPASVFLVGGSAHILGGLATGGAITVTTASGTTTGVSLGSGTVTLTSMGADRIRAGTGTDTVFLEAAPAFVAGGTGSLTVLNTDTSLLDTQTVYGGAGAINYSQWAGALHFIGGAGSASIDGGSGALNVTGGAGSLTITGGAAPTRFVAGSGEATVDMPVEGGTVEFGSGVTNVQVAGWGAGDLFRFVSGHGGGTDTITGFRPGVDQLAFSGVTVASETIAGGSTTLGLSDNTTVVLAGWADTSHLF